MNDLDRFNEGGMTEEEYNNLKFIEARFATYYGNPRCFELNNKYYMQVEEGSGYGSFKEISKMFFYAWVEEFKDE